MLYFFQSKKEIIKKIYFHNFDIKINIYIRVSNITYHFIMRKYKLKQKIIKIELKIRFIK